MIWNPALKKVLTYLGSADLKSAARENAFLFVGGLQIISGWKIILGMLLYKVGFPFLRNPTSYGNMPEWSLTQIPTINNH